MENLRNFISVTHLEMAKLLTELENTKEFLIYSYERFLAYEAYIRFCNKESPINKNQTKNS
jgi:hypothetical protein